MSVLPPNSKFDILQCSTKAYWIWFRYNIGLLSGKVTVRIWILLAHTVPIIRYVNNAFSSKSVTTNWTILDLNPSNSFQPNLFTFFCTDRLLMTPNIFKAPFFSSSMPPVLVISIYNFYLNTLPSASLNMWENMHNN